MSTRRLPLSLTLVAILQFVAPLVMSPSLYSGIGLPIWIVAALLFGLLGVNLLRLKDWARLATVFVQGFNIIVRILTLVGNAVPAGGTGEADMAFIATSLLSMVLSGIVLYTIDQPDVQLLMQQ